LAGVWPTRLLSSRSRREDSKGPAHFPVSGRRLRRRLTASVSGGRRVSAVKVRPRRSCRLRWSVGHPRRRRGRRRPRASVSGAAMAGSWSSGSVTSTPTRPLAVRTIGSSSRGRGRWRWSPISSVSSSAVSMTAGSVSTDSSPWTGPRLRGRGSRFPRRTTGGAGAARAPHFPRRRLGAGVLARTTGPARPGRRGRPGVPCRPGPSRPTPVRSERRRSRPTVCAAPPHRGWRRASPPGRRAVRWLPPAPTRPEQYCPLSRPRRGEAQGRTAPGRRASKDRRLGRRRRSSPAGGSASTGTHRALNRQ